jgi:methylated-DNA-[protein]-cysteine S-methyltransferase
MFQPEPDWILRVTANERGVSRIETNPESGPAGLRKDECPILRHAVEELRGYFAGHLREFSVPLDLRGTPFQMRVWQELQHIPYGETRTYLDLARAVDDANATRAVGAANGRNPIAIIIPCHRVISTGGGLGGYGGGIEFKRRLLAIEWAFARQIRMDFST